MKECVWYFCLAAVAQAQTGYLTYATGIAPSGVTAADLNGDGRPDLVIANAGSDSLTILLNDTTGGFTTLAPFSLGQTTSTIAADLNGDGKIDLVVITPGLGLPGVGLVVLLGNGDGTFQSPLPVSGCAEATGVQVADLNGDSVPDLAVTCLIASGFGIPTGAYLLTLPGNGDGTFGAATQFSLGPTPWAVLAIADFNQDGKPDVAVATEGTLTVFLNDGKANFKPIASVGEPWNYAPAIAAGDFNGDGLVDLAVSGQSAANLQLGIVAVLLGKGNGTFQAAPSLQTNGYGQLIAVDLNGDGHVDLAEGLDTLVFYAGRGDGTFETGFPFGGSGSIGSSLALADFTGSGVMGFAGTNVLVTPSGETNGNIVILPRAVWPSLTVANVSAAGFGLGPLAPGSIATAFGSNLAAGSATATGTPPVSLGGTTVSVTDSAGATRAAQLDYVSPAQVNYLIPSDTAPGLATVDINASGHVAATGQIQVIPVAPALFTVNSDNLAAANVLRISQNGDRTFESIYQTNQNGGITAIPIDLGAPTDSVYVSLYGTGIRNLSSLSAVSATINWEFSAPV
ncbi:MAG: FG-GAP-like repeat-containing protein, partial [Bryobacteraceae bacterium]